MFTTFSTSNTAPWKPIQSSHSAAADPYHDPRRSKRSQVGKACENCRSQRIRCSEGKPCKNCVNKEIDCLVVGGPRGESKRRPARKSPQRSDQCARKSFISVKLMPATAPPECGKSDHDKPLVDPPPASARGCFKDLFKRLNEHVLRIANKNGVHWNGASYENLYSTLFIGDKITGQDTNVQSPQIQPVNLKLQRAAAYTVQLYWHSFHVLYPILHESSIKRTLYQTDNRNANSPTPLLDVGLALCQQLTPQGSRHNARRPEGWDDYLRFEVCTSNVSMNPSLVDAQGWTMAAVYLERAGRTCAAASRLSTAVFVARALRDDPEKQDASHAEKTLRARIWLCIYVIDTRLARDLGCAYQVDNSAFHDNVALAGLRVEGEPEYPSRRDDINWLDYHFWIASLMKIFRDIQDNHLRQCHRIDSHAADFAALEQEAAAYDQETFQGFADWREAVPRWLVTPRIDSKPGLSLHTGPMQIDTQSPMWIQRQRFSLEILYHELKMSLYFGFFQFPHSQKLAVPNIERHQCACLQHGLVNAGVIEQITRQFDAKEGAPQLVRHLFRATCCIVAFASAHPSTPLGRTARSGLLTVRRALKTLEEHCDEATYLMDYIDCLSVVLQTQSGDERSAAVRNPEKINCAPPYGALDDEMAWESNHADDYGEFCSDRMIFEPPL